MPLPDDLPDAEIGAGQITAGISANGIGNAKLSGTGIAFRVGEIGSTQIRPSEQPHFWEKRIVACVPSNGCLAVHATKSPRI